MLNGNLSNFHHLLSKCYESTKSLKLITANTSKTINQIRKYISSSKNKMNNLFVNNLGFQQILNY